jgi:hypothetical protein
MAFTSSRNTARIAAAAQIVAIVSIPVGAAEPLE